MSKKVALTYEGDYIPISMKSGLAFIQIRIDFFIGSLKIEIDFQNKWRIQY
eukprot:TRINITY_DN7204_c0_g1_i1.p1 TRINITY_DN7204_c0_g1~~TRINITY_DN7204_c0_g1_i1.p1  ORF type:complete len:51 (+),score=4.72 TRINITY_DN7204_c0_g1_i1:348-500(+)